MIFEGSAVALATPFTEDGVNFDTLEKLLEFQICEGTDAILICGTTGEPATMTAEEKDSIVSFAVKTVNGRVPVIAGVGGNNTMESAHAAERARDAGAAAVLAVTPYYNKCTADGLCQHFSKIADIGQLPLIVYNVPSRTSMNVTPELFMRLMQNPRIVAIKEASGNISQVAEIARHVGDRAAIYSGNDDQVVPILSLGGKGVISVLANIMPRFVHDLVRAYLDGHTDKARRMQLEVNGLVQALFSDVNPIPVKTALHVMGYDMGDLRLPLTRMSMEHERQLLNEMSLFGLIPEEAEE